MRRGIGNNFVYDGENGTFDEFEAAFKYDCIIYNCNDAQKIEAILICLTGKAKNPNSLPKSLSEKIENFIETGNKSKCLDLRKTNLTINSALNAEEAKCAVGKVKFKMNDWEGEHEFIFANISASNFRY
ncbi:unnamed protein product [Brachionus calyciflorus]|uniref:Uncharacterized protein n=1 Tax=Brachionus calyciflorus TaxID=104777 RepID=A0A814A3V0_9BILA|nr:unnamed protein product [Brachionus calyciflorus]